MYFYYKIFEKKCLLSEVRQTMEIINVYGSGPTGYIY